MTPDELRRLDNDLCIIYEKGLKPIKADKYYYFKYPTAKLEKQYPADHNDIEPIDRGEWRTFNPYNPQDDDEVERPEAQIESLDDLFEEEVSTEELEELIAENSETAAETPKVEQTVPVKAPQKPKVAVQAKPQDEFEDLLAPTLPQEPETEDLAVDIQKELEDKFDELFGAFEDEEENE